MKPAEPLVPRWLAPAAALSLAGGILLGSRMNSIVPGLVCTVLALVCVLVRRDRRCLWALALLAAALGMVLGQRAYHPVLPETGTYTVTGVVSEELVQRDNRQIHTSLTELTLNGRPVAGSAYWSFYQETIPEGLTPGCRVSFTASLYHPTGATNDGGYDFRAYLLQRGITFGLYGGLDDLVIGPVGFSPAGWIAALRHALLLRLEQVMGPEAGAYAGTMLLGVKSLVPTDEREAFNALGIGHILSVSGFHVGVLYAVLILLLRRIVSAVRVAGGQNVARGQVLLRIDRTDKLEVIASVDEMDLNGIQVGSSVSVTLDTDETQILTGMVTEISGMGVSKTNASYFDVHVSLPEGIDARLGGNASVYIPR